MSTGTVVRRGEPHDVPILSRLVDEVMRPYVVAGQGMAKRFPLLYQSAQSITAIVPKFRARTVGNLKRATISRIDQSCVFTISLTKRVP